MHENPLQASGLYDPRYEHDACGVALVARLDNVASHEVIDKALTALENLEHRGAAGADKHTGDGAGILLQMPDGFFRGVVDFELPPLGRYGVAVCFLPRDAARRRKIDVHRPYAELPEAVRRWVYEGDEDFCGIRGFFEEVEGYRYKLHVRVFLSRYRSQVPCTACGPEPCPPISPTPSAKSSAGMTANAPALRPTSRAC